MRPLIAGNWWAIGSGQTPTIEQIADMPCAHPDPAQI